MVVMAQLQNYGRWTFAKTTMGGGWWRTKASLWGRWQEWVHLHLPGNRRGGARGAGLLYLPPCALGLSLRNALEAQPTSDYTPH